MPPTLIYDDACGLCTAGVARLRRWVAVEVALVGRETLAARARWPELAADDSLRALHLALGGRLYAGAEAIARLLWLDWRWRPVVWVYWLPGVRQAAGAAYRAVARRRYQWAGRCETG